MEPENASASYASVMGQSSHRVSQRERHLSLRGLACQLGNGPALLTGCRGWLMDRLRQRGALWPLHTGRAGAGRREGLGGLLSEQTAACSGATLAVKRSPRRPAYLPQEIRKR